ncbi:heme ABC transporter permease/ATP-binding protein CydD [Endozoicomonadaceae bacterium StTr2]
MNSAREREVYRWLGGLVSHAGLWPRLVVANGVLTGLIIMGQALLLAHIIQQVVMEGVGVDRLSFPLVGFALLVLMRAGLIFLRDFTAFKAGAAIRVEVRKQLLERFRELGPVGLRRRSAGAWTTTVLEQVEKLHDFYAHYQPQMKIAVFIPTLIFLAAASQDWIVALVFAVTAPLVPVFMILVGRKAAQASQQNFNALARMGGHFLDRLQGLGTLKLFNQAEAEGVAVSRAADRFRQHTMKVLRLAFLSSAVLEFFTALSIALTAVYLGLSYLGHINFGAASEMTLFTGLFLLLLAPEFYQPLRDLGSFYHARAEAIGAGDAILEVLELSNDDQEEAETEARSSYPVQWQGARWVLAKDLTVYSTNTGAKLLDNISFEIYPGQKVAVVGASGAGKTTLVETLLGFHEFGGLLEFDGRDAERLQPENWRRGLTWIGQNPLLIQGTVRENVTLGRPELDDHAVHSALVWSQAWEFVERLPQGIDTPLQEEGSSLSVGQAQRIALARAMAHKQDEPPAGLFIMDEPTASLDRYSEARVHQALRKLTRQSTVFMVTHRFDLLDDVDTILVMDHGRIVEQGTLASLKQDSVIFNRLLAEWEGEQA